MNQYYSTLNWQGSKPNNKKFKQKRHIKVIDTFNLKQHSQYGDIKGRKHFPQVNSQTMVYKSAVKLFPEIYNKKTLDYNDILIKKHAELRLSKCPSSLTKLQMLKQGYLKNGIYRFAKKSKKQ